MGKNSELMVKLYGFTISPEFTPKVVAVTTSAALLLKAFADRVHILAVNLGDQVCYIHPGPDVTSSLGIYVDKNGGFAELPLLLYGELLTYEWWVVGAGATTLYLACLKGV